MPALQGHCPGSNGKEWLFLQQQVHSAPCTGLCAWAGRRKVCLCLGKHCKGNLSLRSVSKTNAEGMNLYACLRHNSIVHAYAMHTHSSRIIPGGKEMSLCSTCTEEQEGQRDGRIGPAFPEEQQEDRACKSSIRWQAVGMSSSLCPGWMAHKQGSATATASKEWK